MISGIVVEPMLCLFYKIRNDRTKMNIVYFLIKNFLGQDIFLKPTEKLFFYQFCTYLVITSFYDVHPRRQM